MDTSSTSEISETGMFRAALGEDRFEALLGYLDVVTVDAGTVLMRAGGKDDSTFLVLAGELRIGKVGEVPTVVTAGDLVGGLVPTAEGASIVTNATTKVGRLSAEGWQRVCKEHPDIALQALRALMIRAGENRTDTLQALSLFLPSAQDELGEIDVRLNGNTQRVVVGTLASQLLPERVDDKLVVAALLDRKAVTLTTPITAACRVEPLTTATLDGQRFYRQSQALLLLEAAYQIDPNLNPRMSHSLGFAQRVEITPSGDESLESLAQRIDARMQELVDANVPLIEDWCSVSEASSNFEARGWTDAAEQLMVSHTALVKLVSYGETFVTSPGPLVPSTGLIGEARLVADGDVLLLVYGTEGGRPISGASDSLTSRNQAVAATGRFAAVSAYRTSGPAAQEQHRWLSAIGIDSVGKFNQACITGDVSQIIRVSEGFQEKRIGAIADEIAACGRRLKLVAVAGPSSSGKSTFIRRLKVQLQVNGLSPLELSLDDYYVDREETPRDSKGDYDYESIEALQLGLLKEHLRQITAGEDVQTPRYDFQTGLSIPNGGPRVCLGPTDVLMVEGIHGLNPAILRLVDADAAFRIFICPLTQLPFDPLTRVHVSDVRLLRRIVRDRYARCAPAADTIMRWPSVQAGERLNITPFQQYADAVFDSSLVYELAVLKVYAERYLLEVPRTHPAYTTAHRLLHLIGSFVAIYPDHVPPTSILREFIGGSGFER